MTRQTFISGLYSVISSSKVCNHKEGGYPYRCSKAVVDTNQCEEQCSKYFLCNGYSFGSGNCLIFPSQNSCPPDWNSHHGKVTSNWNDLEEGTHSAYNCKAIQRRSIGDHLLPLVPVILLFHDVLSSIIILYSCFKNALTS